MDWLPSSKDRVAAEQGKGKMQCLSFAVMEQGAGWGGTNWGPPRCWSLSHLTRSLKGIPLEQRSPEPPVVFPLLTAPPVSTSSTMVVVIIQAQQLEAESPSLELFKRHGVPSKREPSFAMLLPMASFIKIVVDQSLCTSQYCFRSHGSGY
ncbi:hypothetical protein llap_1570 [Limosa lapponica baueri]|uniref:Uncharacterized protein n=1 Tax=Limosa lapponica baueri TaxID=1758121 RepID=A0A2I0UPY6_LIMLA|nr:hypothetical protein llap_1570 [Limosa lapponica baueri]